MFLRASSRGFSGERRTPLQAGLGPGCLRELLLEAFRQELLEEGLVWNVSLVGEDLELPDHGFGKAKRDGAKGRLKVREGPPLRR